MFKIHVWKESLVALALVFGLSTAAHARPEMSVSWLSGDYVVFLQEPVIDNGGIVNVGGSIDFFFNGNGTCTWSGSDVAYSAALDSPTSVTVTGDSASGSCSYTVSVDGRVDVQFDNHDIGDLETWQLSTDGNYLLGGGANLDNATSSYETYQDVGIKLGTAVTASQLNGVYKMRSVDFELWESIYGVADGIWSDQFDLTFNGAGGCTISNYSGLGYEKFINSVSPIDVWPDSMPTTSCTYAVSGGKITLNLPDETVYAWVSADAELLVRGGTDAYYEADGTYYTAHQMFGVKQISSASNASLVGTFYMNTQEGGFSEFTKGPNVAYSKDNYYADMVFTFDGSGGCSGQFVDTLFVTSYFAPYATSSQVDSGDMGACTYSVASNGLVTVSFPDAGDTYVAELGADGGLLQFREVFTDTETVDGGTLVTYGAAHGLGIKVFSYELAFPVSASADFNADNVSDVLFQNSGDGRLLLWTMNNFARTVTFPQALAVDWDVVGKGDFNGDGTADVLYMKADGSTAIAEMSNAARTNLKFPGGINPVWQVKGVGDFNGDGTDDILLRRSTDGVTLIWGMVNSARAKVSWPGGLATFWDIVGTGDFDGDGIDDILCQHNTDGRLLIWKMNNYGRASVALPQSLANTWTVVGVGDFNADGTDDVLYRKDTGDVAIAEFAGLNRSALKFPGGIGLPWSVQDVGDYNGDGTDDIFFRRASDGVTLAWGIVNSARAKVAWPGAAATTWDVQ